jgi:hypothetical protein
MGTHLHQPKGRPAPEDAVADARRSATCGKRSREPPPPRVITIPHLTTVLLLASMTTAMAATSAARAAGRVSPVPIECRASRCGLSLPSLSGSILPYGKRLTARRHTVKHGNALIARDIVGLGVCSGVRRNAKTRPFKAETGVQFPLGTPANLRLTADQDAGVGHSSHKTPKPDQRPAGCRRER